MKTYNLTINITGEVSQILQQLVDIRNEIVSKIDVETGNLEKQFENEEEGDTVITGKGYDMEILTIK